MPRTSSNDARRPKPQRAVRGQGTLGTFGGVFTPSILTILGVIMYLRFGWVVGNVGLLGTLVIVTLSTSITFLTGLSVSAIATDQRVRIGGAYYMVSRSIGLESGGAVGIPLYLAQALSVALYTIGFAESVVEVMPSWDVRLVGVVTTIGVAVLALTSARIAIRAQYFIMAAIALSLVSLLLGRPIEATDIELWGMPDQASAGFWTVFAVFFPAVTGIMAGVNLSGDLKDPGRSLPTGTLAAVGVGYLVYMTLPVVLASRADAATLIEDTLIMRRISLWGDAIMLGVWGATLSSAVGSILGAPRVLQALARDGVLPRPLRWLGRGSGPEDEPRAGTAVTLGVALAAVLLGNLNLIAPVLTMFFLTTYAALNLSAGIEEFLGSPSYRPKFRVHWSLSILGAVGCAAVMVLINLWATVVAAVVVLAIFLWLERREMRAAWGDVRRGMWLALVRAGLLRLTGTPDPKNWRPHLLVLSGAPTSRWHLIDLASSLTHNRGLITVATVLPEDVEQERVSGMEATIRDYLMRHGTEAMVRVVSAPDPFAGAGRLVEAYGLGPLMPNTILLGASEEPSHRQRFCSMIERFHKARRNVLVVNHDRHGSFGAHRRIDIWWGGLRRNGGLMMILAHLLRTSLRWGGAEITLKIVMPNREAADNVRDNLESIVESSRTGARVEVLRAEGRPFEEILHTSSRDADLVLMGMAEPAGEFEEYYKRITGWLEDMPATLLVLAAEDLEFGEVLLEPPAQRDL